MNVRDYVAIKVWTPHSLQRSKSSSYASCFAVKSLYQQFEARSLSRQIKWRRRIGATKCRAFFVARPHPRDIWKARGFCPTASSRDTRSWRFIVVFLWISQQKQNPRCVPSLFFVLIKRCSLSCLGTTSNESKSFQERNVGTKSQCYLIFLRTAIGRPGHCLL